MTAAESTTITLGPITAQIVGAPEDKVTYQWQKNGVDIPGANAASYTTPPLVLAETGAEYSAKVLLSGLSAVSGKAKVTITKDMDCQKCSLLIR